VTETTPKTVYYTATTLDGYIADSADALDWLFVQDIDADGPMNYNAFIAGIGAIVMGATTYEWIRARIVEGSEKWGYTAYGRVHPPRPVDGRGRRPAVRLRRRHCCARRAGGSRGW
jgi:dihydrofolate reductase